ncbi:hypothetical protein RR48_13323 [Papilio machaon]|uniref:Uncharacterized protein n=1 Tax=Papilio machaon TaxID=76193 RepID=A0A194QWK5_PAPMA|nr:hypothetical protein RR48_13323 [Papilio machaon]
MTIKNKKTKQSKASEVTTSSSASSSVQKSSTSTVQKSSNTLQKVSSTGKKIRYIDVKVEEDDPLMITDVTDHASITGSTISEHYNSHPHYIITEAPSVTDLSQIRSHEHNISDMAQSTTGEFVSNSVLQESSSVHQQSSKSETIQSSSTSVQHSNSSHSQTFDRTVDSSIENQTLNTAFIDSTAHDATGSNTYTRRPQGANATNSLIQSERENATNTQSTQQSFISRRDMKDNFSKITDKKFVNQREKDSYHSPDGSKRSQTVKSDSRNFYGAEGTLDRNNKSTEFTSTNQTSENKSSSVTKSSSSSYVVEIVDGKERIIDSSKREWGDAKEHSSKEAYASVSGTNVTPQSVHSQQNYDMKSKYDTGKNGDQPKSEMTIREDSRLVKDGTQISSHQNVISHKDNLQQIKSTQDQMLTRDNVQHTNMTSHQQDNLRQIKSTEDQMSARDNEQHTNMTSRHQENLQHIKSTQDQLSTRDNVHHTTTMSDVSNTMQSNTNIVESSTTSNETTSLQRRNQNTRTDSSNFYGYDTTIQNELRKVGDILDVRDTDSINFSTKILKSNTSSAQQASTSSYVLEVVDGKQRVVDSSHREWGDSKELSTHEKSHHVSGPGIKPEHEYTRHVLDKESYYDTGKDGIPKSATHVAEESALYRDGKEIASTRNVYSGDFTKKPAITEPPSSEVDDKGRIIRDSTDKTVYSDIQKTTSTDRKTEKRDVKDVTKTTEFITKEQQNLTKESTSKNTSETKDTLTTYERSTGTWNGKFVYETGDDRPKRPKDMSPFGQPEQPRHHLKRQDTHDNIILTSKDIKDFTSISDLRKIIETSSSNKDVTVSNKNIVIRRNIDDRVLKDIIETVKKYPFKRIDKVTFGTKINEDVKDLYEGVDTEQINVIKTTNADLIKKSYEIDKTRSQVEVTRYITENGVTRKVTTYEDAKEDEKVKTNVFVDNSELDIKNLKDVRTVRDVREYDVVDHAITDTTRQDIVTTVYDETIIDDRKTVRDDRTVVEKTVYIDETRPKHGGPKKPEKPVIKEQCICEICTCG